MVRLVSGILQDPKTQVQLQWFFSILDLNGDCQLLFDDYKIKIQIIMITQQTLKQQVLAHLRKKYSIKLELPSFKRHISEKINLKLFRSPLGDNLPRNRYSILITISEELLKKNIINTEKIKQFGEQFFQTINQDIQVMTNNEEIRRNFTRIRDQLAYRIEELNVQQRKIEEQCRNIDDKEDIVTFFDGIFKNYLTNVKVVSENYDTVNNVQVYTSVNIDKIYSESLADQEDYMQHFQPLLEVMQRLKANMTKLYQQLTHCQYFQLPLKSVNFLANCKSLLMELEPFLIQPDCVFNRLIFHVTRGQKQNNRLISKAFLSNMVFTNHIVSDIFKSFFLGHLFKDYYMTIKGRISVERQQLIGCFEGRTGENFNHASLRIQKKIEAIRNDIDSLNRVIGSGKDKIMREYLGRKECKKTNLLDQMQTQLGQIMQLSSTMRQLLKHRNKLQYFSQKEIQIEQHVAYTVNSIKDLETNNIRAQKPANSNVKDIEAKLVERIQQSYMFIQEGLISVQHMTVLLKQAKQETESDSYFAKNYFPKQEQVLVQLESRYNSLEIALLNSYQNLRKEKIQKTEQTKQTKQQILQELNDYFQNKISGEMGYEIRNEDQQCEEVKDNIIKIEKVEFMVSSYLSKNNQEAEELIRAKLNLEWLLQLFEGSMDQKIFQNFLQKLNFDVQDWKEKAFKVKELIKELTRYVGILKGIIKSNSIGKVHPKVYKLIKNRIQLYQIIQDMYEQFILIYQTCKASSQLNISDHGLKLFDELTYKYVLMLYQYKNRMRAEMQEIKDLLLPTSTINYLLDQLYEPFLQIFNNFITYSESQLLNFTLRLEHALNFKLSYRDILKMFQKTLARPYSKGFFNSVLKICQEMVEMRSQNTKVINLEEEEVIIHNLAEFKDIMELVKEHVVMAECVVRELKDKDLLLEAEFRQASLEAIRLKLINDWQQHRQQAQASLQQSRADDFPNQI